MKLITSLLFILGLFTSNISIANTESQTAEEYYAAAKQIWDTLDHQQGSITLPNNVATLNVPDSFYYLNPKDSEEVLTTLWGNPPGAGTQSLGMLLPSSTTPYSDDSWAVTIEYEEDGYVSDEDAEDLNYDDLLKEMKEQTQASSQQRVEQGYDAMSLVGWASTPYYDQQAHKLHWAKEMKFGDLETNTLNYNIRILGRKGVLVLNFIAGMEQKSTIEANLDDVLAIAEFSDGSKYDDFDPSMDTIAAYGIGALVAGKLIAKTGFIALAIIFLKKFGIFILIGLGVLLKRFFKRK